MSRDGLLPPGVSHSDRHFWPEDVDCPECESPIDYAMDECELCGRPVSPDDFEPDYEDDYA